MHLKTPKTKQRIAEKEAQLIQTLGDSWTIPAVQYRGRTEPYSLANTLLDDGIKRTQEQWAERAVTYMQKGKGHYSPDLPLAHGIFSRVYEIKDVPENRKQALDIRDFLNKASNKWISTLTRISYQPTGKDFIIHNYNVPNKMPNG